MCLVSYKPGDTKALKDECFTDSLLLAGKERKLTPSSSSKAQCLISDPNPRAVFIDQTD